MLILGVLISVTVLSQRAYCSESTIIFLDDPVTILFSSWDDEWTPLVNFERDLFREDYFCNPYTIEVRYEGESAPYLVFSSWSGGPKWSQFLPSYVLEDVAYYESDMIEQEFGRDYSLLDRISVMPAPSKDETIVHHVLIKKNQMTFPEFKGLAGRIVRDINVGWNLGNTFDAHGKWIEDEENVTAFETAWGNPVTTEEIILSVKEAGFNAIRIPVTWSQHIDLEYGYKIDDEWMDRIKEVVDYVLSQDMYCIINLHHDTGSGDDSWLNASRHCLKKEDDKFVSIWRQIAQTFKAYDARLLFEGFNEILNLKNQWLYPGESAGYAVNRFNQLFVDTVRESGGNNRFRCLIVNPYAAAIDADSFHDFYLPNDAARDSLIVGCHYYYPISYCGEIQEDEYQQRNWRLMEGEELMEEKLSLISDRFTSRNILVILSECGAANKENSTDRADWVRSLKQKA